MGRKAGSHTRAQGALIRNDGCDRTDGLRPTPQGEEFTCFLPWSE